MITVPIWEHFPELLLWISERVEDAREECRANGLMRHPSPQEVTLARDWWVLMTAFQRMASAVSTTLHLDLNAPRSTELLKKELTALAELL